MAKKFQSNQSTKKQPNQKQPNKSEVINAREFDAAGQILGRLASQITIVLRGKDKPGFRPNLVLGENVKVINASKIVLTGKKLEDKKYYHHTGYLGNLKTTSAKELMATNPAEILERAIYGMLPANKLRPEWMKKLVITN